MKAIALRVVGDNAVHSLNQRIAEMQADLQVLNAQQVAELRIAATAAMEQAKAVAANPTQAPGLQQIAARFARAAEDMETSLSLLQPKK